MADGATVMTVFLSKVLQTLIFPLGMAMALAVLGLVLLLLRRHRSGAVMIATGLTVLWVASIPPTAGWLTSLLERDYPPRTVAETPRAELAIVLGGALGGAAPPRVAPDLGGGADRIWFAAQLFRQGRVQRLLVTGGNTPWTPDAAPEAESIRDLLVAWGVPATAIEVETKSQNTWQNALGARRFIAEDSVGPALLVTSGTHMRRALATFRKAGLEVIPATAEVSYTQGGRFTVLGLIPDAGALNQTTLAFKEHLGLLVYRILGRAE